MNILIQLSHPAHFHLYKLVAKNLIDNGHKVLFVIKSKDILEQLLQNAGLPYVNINQHAHRGSKLGILWDMFVREWRIWKLCRRHQIDLLTGSTPEVAHVAKLTGRRSVNTGEDDADVISMFIKIAKPFIDGYAAPNPCEMGPVEPKTSHYPGYHELAYLHPNHFTPDEKVVKGYDIDVTKPYFILRFASLNAHHDDGIKGINTEIAQKLIDILSPHGRIYITSERPLEPQFEQYRIKINPLDMHHVMAFASLYIGDSQTMAAEAGVLGVPFVRFNDFVGRIGYLRELEDIYHLGFGIHATPLSPSNLQLVPHPHNQSSNTEEKEQVSSPESKVSACSLSPLIVSADHVEKEQPSGPEAMYRIVEQLVSMDATERRALYQQRRQKMLSEKIDCAKFLTWFIEEYPKSVEETKKGGEKFWKRFK